MKNAKKTAEWLNSLPPVTVTQGEGEQILFWADDPIKLLYPTLVMHSMAGDCIHWDEPIEIKSTQTMWRSYKR